jgi:hypothetical protein
LWFIRRLRTAILLVSITFRYQYISLFRCLCCPIVSLYVHSSVLWCPLRFLHENDALFVFTSSRAHVLLCVLCMFAYSDVQHVALSNDFTFCVPCCDVRIKTMFDSLIPPVVCRRVHVLFTLFVFVHSGVQHILCCVFVLFVFVLCLVYLMLSVSLDCPFLITPSVIFNVYHK